MCIISIFCLFYNTGGVKANWSSDLLKKYFMNWYLGKKSNKKIKDKMHSYCLKTINQYSNDYSKEVKNISRSDCIFEIHQLWQSGFSRVYSNCYCSCSFEPEIIKIGQSSQKMYSNNILNFQESTRIWNACTNMSGNLLKAPHIYGG